MEDKTKPKLVQIIDEYLDAFAADDEELMFQSGSGT